MVFIKSQEYTDTFGRKSKNVICLEGQTDYKISYNNETNEWDMLIVVGDFHKYLFSGSSEDQCSRILQNIFGQHVKGEPFSIIDVNAFMIPDIEEEDTLDEIEDLMVNILKFHGYEGLVDAWEAKLDEECEPTFAINEKNELSIGGQVVTSSSDQSNPPTNNILEGVQYHG